MKKILVASLYACLIGGLFGCEDAPNPTTQNGQATSAATPGNPGEAQSADANKPVAQQAIEAAVTSPETANRLAKASPEATAVAAQKEAETVASQAAAAPESALVKVTAYAKLAAVASEAAPDSAAAKDAAAQTERLKAQVESLSKPSPKQ